MEGLPTSKITSSGHQVDHVGVLLYFHLLGWSLGGLLSCTASLRPETTCLLKHMQRCLLSQLCIARRNAQLVPCMQRSWQTA